MEEEDTEAEGTENEAGEVPAKPESGKRRRSRSNGRRRERSEALERTGILAALEAGISEALPGVEILDRDLAFEPGGRADLVAVDPLGRLVLVLVAGDDSERAVIDALDLLAYAEANAALLVRHLGSRRVDPGLHARAVVIDPANDERLAERLHVIASSGVEVFGVRTLKSAAGERSYLVASGTDGATGRSGEVGVQGFLQALPLPLQDMGRALAARMSRLDEELLATADRTALVWRFQGQVLARLECSGSGLTASVAPHHDPAPLRGPADVDGVLEGALARLLAECRAAERVLDGHTFGEERPLPDRDFASDEPILTQEEIQAFRD